MRPLLHFKRYCRQVFNNTRYNCRHLWCHGSYFQVWTSIRKRSLYLLSFNFSYKPKKKIYYLKQHSIISDSTAVIERYKSNKNVLQKSYVWKTTPLTKMHCFGLKYISPCIQVYVSFMKPIFSFQKFSVFDYGLQILKTNLALSITLLKRRATKRIGKKEAILCSNSR